MKTTIKATRSALVAGAAATLAIVAMGFAGAAQARDDLSFSVGIGVPGVQFGVSNAYPVYRQPVYEQPAPVYYQPAPVYYPPAPVYYQPRPVYVRPAPVYYAPQTVYYDRPHHRYPRGGGYYQQGPRGYGPGYASGYYQRNDQDGNRHGDR